MGLAARSSVRTGRSRRRCGDLAQSVTDFGCFATGTSSSTRTPFNGQAETLVKRTDECFGAISVGGVQEPDDGDHPVLTCAATQGSRVACALLNVELRELQQRRKENGSCFERVFSLLRSAGLGHGKQLRTAVAAYLAGDLPAPPPGLPRAALRALVELDAELLACHGILLEDLPAATLEVWVLDLRLLHDGDQVRVLREQLYGDSRFPILTPQAAQTALAPDSHVTTWRRQFVIERDTYRIAQVEYLAEQQKLMEKGLGGTSGPSRRLWLSWVEGMAQHIEELRKPDHRIRGVGALGVGEMANLPLEPQVLAVMTCSAMLNLILLPSNVHHRHKDDRNQYVGMVSFVMAVVAVGEAVEAECGFREHDFSPTKRNSSNRRSALAGKVFRRRWEKRTVVHLGSALVDVLLQTAFVEVPKDSRDACEAVSEQAGANAISHRPLPSKNHVWVPAFTHALVREGKKTVGYVSLRRQAREQLDLSEDTLMAFIAPRQQPMVRPPRPWRPSSGNAEGGYLMHKVPFIRTTNPNLGVLKAHNPQRVAKVMDYVGSAPWRVNSRILEHISEVQNRDLAVAEVPPRLDPEISDLPASMEGMPEADQRTLRIQHQNATRRCQELQSERPTFELKLRVAKDFLHAPRLYFPHSVDFRGRAYPVPPHLNHIGDDVCRGLLMFADAEPLGERGAFWLKVSLANLMGKDKASFEERAAFVDGAKEQILEVAAAPLKTENIDFWASAGDGPWQALARCIELADMWRAGDERSFRSHLPIHLDGSCNGLQHYAALGRDKEGGLAVNLLDAERPQDVYTIVLRIVIQKVKRDAQAEELAEQEATGTASQTSDTGTLARRLLTLDVLQRKVVKQTIMTICYGVTAIGAKKQVEGQLHDMVGDRVEAKEISELAKYLSRLVLRSIDEVFERAMKIKNWFDKVSAMFNRLEFPTSWISPIGLGCVQPYKKTESVIVKTKRQSVSLNDDDGVDVDKVKQRMGFPPNFIHSLDASHMMLVAEGCQKHGLVFAGVHDSFWTHACHADTLSVIIREKFFDLHRQPLLQELYEDVRVHLGGVEPPALPEQGALDLSQVRRSTYIFS